MSRLPANERFRAAADSLGIEPDIVQFSEDTRTAVQAAAALNCELGQIIKSLVFQCDGEPVLALTAGDQKVDIKTLGELCGGTIEKRARTSSAMQLGLPSAACRPSVIRPSCNVSLIGTFADTRKCGVRRALPILFSLSTVIDLSN